MDIRFVIRSTDSSLPLPFSDITSRTPGSNNAKLTQDRMPSCNQHAYAHWMLTEILEQ